MSIRDGFGAHSGVRKTRAHRDADRYGQQSVINGFRALRRGVATARELAEIWIGLRRGTVFPLNPLTGLFGFAGRRGYMVPDSGLRA
jgi:hypothetical protein